MRFAATPPWPIARNSTAKPGREEKRDLWEDYAEHVRQFLHPEDCVDGSRTLKVVIDASNGMAGTMIPKVFGDVPGLKITKINFDNSTGEFVHEPNPLVEANLEQLQGRGEIQQGRRRHLLRRRCRPLRGRR